MHIKVTADSTCDLSPALLQEFDITLAPLSVIKDGTCFQDGVTITPEDIFRHVASGGKLCSTAAVTMMDYYGLFSKYSKEYDAVIHVTIGSDFSSCYQNASVAAQEFPNVRVIDSRNLSTGQGQIVMEACRRRETARDLDSLCDELRALTSKVETSFILNRLDYMVKGGRCSSVVALGANLLHLKPCIEVKDGKMQVVKKYRGSYEKCLRSYIQDRLANREDIVRDHIFITHTPISSEELETAKTAVSEFGHFRRVTETNAGCTISCHCGPGTLGILFIRK